MKSDGRLNRVRYSISRCCSEVRDQAWKMMARGTTGLPLIVCVNGCPVQNWRKAKISKGLQLFATSEACNLSSNAPELY